MSKRGQVSPASVKPASSSKKAYSGVRGRRTTKMQPKPIAEPFWKVDDE